MLRLVLAKSRQLFVRRSKEVATTVVFPEPDIQALRLCFHTQTPSD